MKDTWWIHVLVVAIALSLLGWFIASSENSLMDVLIIAILIIISFLFHFIPSIIAIHRDHKNKLGIFLLNLFLGWTLFGWVGSLIWAVLNENSDKNPDN